MRTFEFEQQGKRFRIEIEYKYYMRKDTAWLDGDVIDMGEKPQESVKTRLYINDELKDSSNAATEYDLRLSEEVRNIKGHEVKTVHGLKLAIIDPETWRKYEAWLADVIEEGTEKEVKEYLQREEEKEAAERLEYAKEVVELAEKQKDIPTKEEAKRRKKWWNDTQNEGGDGFVPTIIDIEQYERAKKIIEKKGKK